MLFTWNEELIPGRVENGIPLTDALLTAAQEFEEVMEAPLGDSSIRKMLGEIPQSGQPSRKSEAWIQFNKALRTHRLGN
jgi:hypothetical protein